MVGASILIADDDATSARLLKRLLVKDGYHVSVVTTAAGALATCAVTPPDLVVIDLLARGDGFRVCRSLKDQPSTRLIPIVIVTSQADHGDRLRAIECGADDFLRHPFDAVEL